METYATPLDRAKALLEEFIAYADAQSYALPQTRYAQIGDITRDCEAVIVAVGALAPDLLYDPTGCIFPMTGTFLVDIIRNCAFHSDEEGMTVVPILEGISEIGAADMQLLWDFAGQVDGWSSKAPWSVVPSLAEGGLQVASLQITIGIS